MTAHKKGYTLRSYKRTGWALSACDIKHHIRSGEGPLLDASVAGVFFIAVFHCPDQRLFDNPVLNKVFRVSPTLQVWPQRRLLRTGRFQWRGSFIHSDENHYHSFPSVHWSGALPSHALEKCGPMDSPASPALRALVTNDNSCAFPSSNPSFLALFELVSFEALE